MLLLGNFIGRVFKCIWVNNIFLFLVLVIVLYLLIFYWLCMNEVSGLYDCMGNYL